MSDTFKSIKIGIEQAIDETKYLLKSKRKRTGERLLKSIDDMKETAMQQTKRNKMFEDKRRESIKSTIRTVGVVLVVILQSISVLHVFGVI